MQCQGRTRLKKPCKNAATWRARCFRFLGKRVGDSARDFFVCAKHKDQCARIVSFTSL